MLKNIGGRGCKNAYKTIVKRIPEVIEADVELLISQLQQQIAAQGYVTFNYHRHKPDREILQHTFLLPKELEAIELAKEILKSKQSASKSITKLLQVIYKNDTIQL